MARSLIADAPQHGPKIETGGRRIGNKGYFFEPTILTAPSLASRVMNEEPFGPLALVTSFGDFDQVVWEANRLPYALAAFAFTNSTKTAPAIANAIESGMVTINHNGLALPETPFGGVKESGYGPEGDAEGMEAYLNTKFISQAGA